MKKLQIENPCPKKWENMQGEDAIRLCESCDRNVENFTDKSVAEIVEILKSRKERTCARVFSSQLNPVKKIAAAVLIGGMLLGGSCSPKVSNETTEVEFYTKKNRKNQGYVKIDDESIIPVVENASGKIPVNIEGIVFDKKGEPLEDCVIAINEIGTMSREGGVFSINGEIEKKDYDSIIVRVHRQRNYSGSASIPLKNLNMKKGIKVYLMDVEIRKYKSGDPIIIGGITIESPIRNS